MRGIGRNRALRAASLRPASLRAAGGAGAAFALTAGLWLLVLALFGIYPFGARSFLITDLSSQYVEYHAALYDMVRQGRSLLYTWDTGLGMNFFGLITYYLASPFTLLLFLFPRALLTEAIVTILSVKIAAAALTACLCLRLVYGVRGVRGILCAAAYALSGYVVVYAFNLMWLDGVVLLPLAVWAARRLFDRGRMAPLVAVLALLFTSNFYIAYMAGLFVCLLYLVWLYVRRGTARENARALGRFFGCAALAAGLAAVVLLPAICALANGNVSAQGPRLTFWLAANPLALPGKLAYGAFDSATSNGTPYLYSGVLTVMLLPLWFCHRDVPAREKRAVGALLLALLLCMTLYDLDVLWHGLQPPTWFPCRYSFVGIFLLLTCAGRVLAHPEGITPRAVAVSGGALLVGMAVCGFSGLPFAGEPLVTVVLVAVYGVLVWLLVYCARRSGRLPRMAARGLPLLLAVCVCAELTGSALRVLGGLDEELHFVPRAEYTAFTARSAQLKNALRQVEEDGFHRVENATARDANDGLSTGYPAVSHYSSLSNQRTFRFLGDLGMVCYVNHRYLRYYGATAALDAVLGVRYVWDTAERRYGVVSTGAVAGDTLVYRNEAALPLAYFTDRALLTMPETGDDPFQLQNALLCALNGRAADYYTPVQAAVTCLGGTLHTEEGRTTITGTGGTLCVDIENPRRGHVLLYLRNNLYENTTVYVDGEALNVYDDRLVRGVIDLGEQPAGTVEVRIPIWTEDAWYEGPYTYAFDGAAFDALIAELRQGSPDELEVTDTAVTGRFTAPRDGLLFTSIPCDGGWTAFIDGERITPEAVAGAFIALPVTAGDHTFTLRFFPQGLRAGLTISLLTLAGIGVWALLRYRRHPWGRVPRDGG